MPFTYTNDGCKISFSLHGNGSNLLILHAGWATSSTYFEGLIKSIEISNWQLASIDQRGTGQSDKPDSGYVIDRLGQDVIAVANHLGAERFALLGHSAGGKVCQFVAGRWPERILGQILVNSAPAMGITLPPEIRQQFNRAPANRELLWLLLSQTMQVLPSIAVRTRLLEELQECPAHVMNQLLDGVISASCSESLSAIQTRTLVVASDDPTMPLDAVRQFVAAPIAGAQVIHVPGAGHHTPIEQPKTLALIVNAFLSALG